MPTSWLSAGFSLAWAISSVFYGVMESHHTSTPPAQASAANPSECHAAQPNGATYIVEPAGGTHDRLSDCLWQEPTEALIIVDRCEVVVPNAHPGLMAFAESYPESYVESVRPEAERTAARILDSYRGAILVWRRNRATGRIFVPSKDSTVCSRFNKGVRIRALVNQTCCDGDPNPPCQLGFSAYVEKLLPL